MERATPVRKPHTSTADLLTWSEIPPADSPASVPRPNSRSHQPSDGISKVVFGGQVTDEEVEVLLRRKPCSGHKMKEMTGNGIFVGDEEDGTSEQGMVTPNPGSKTGLRMYQQAVAGISQISFGIEESVSPKKPTTLPEVAKQRELSGTLEREADAGSKKQLSDAKCKELSGHDIFAPPPEILHHRSDCRDGGEVRTPVTPKRGGGREGGAVIPGEDPVLKTAKKIYDQKFAELMGNDIFRGEAVPGSTEKGLSVAKLREMSGSDIFSAEEKMEKSRDYLGGVRKPPGGESSIALV